MKEPNPKRELDREAYGESARLWDETKLEERQKIMEGKIRDVCYFIMEKAGMLGSPAQEEIIYLLTRAAWVGYCVGKGLIKEKESSVGKGKS